MTDIEQYRKLAQPPSWALKTIAGGRLKGMTDIKPAWRIQAMTEIYGLCGVGWKYEVVRLWTAPGPEDQVFAFADVDLYFKVGDDWSEPIRGNGGNKLVEKERGGLYANDEAFKMAVTDALSSAMKMIGMAADVYAGQWTGSKYSRKAEPAAAPLNPKDIANLVEAINECNDMTTLTETILRGGVYQRLKELGSVDEYEKVSSLAKAKHAVLKGDE